MVDGIEGILTRRKSQTPDTSLPSVPVGVWPLVRALRPLQWSKNALLVAPIFMAHRLDDSTRLTAALIGIVCFSAAASAGYLVNDLLDRVADREHPQKRSRPIASGALSVGIAVAVAIVLIVGALVLSYFCLDSKFLLLLCAYMSGSFFYSFVLKRIFILDVIALATLYMLRVIAGGVAADVPVTTWFLGFSFGMFGCLALSKRLDEMSMLLQRDVEEVAGRGYHLGQRLVISLLTWVTGCSAVVLMACYVASEQVSELYREPSYLWALVPVILAWITHIWRRARTGAMHSDPVAFALRDPFSLACGVAVIGFVRLAT